MGFTPYFHQCKIQSSRKLSSCLKLNSKRQDFENNAGTIFEEKARLIQALPDLEKHKKGRRALSKDFPSKNSFLISDFSQLLQLS